ncbi:MAG: hypothetical protein IH897_09925, partial [Planctomycetes bacterium]|nr:hypothetical protein [Planctomycetota bacterium]
TPGFNDAGTYPMTVIASDGSLTDDYAFTLTVNNVAPTPSIAGVTEAVVNQTLSFTLTAGDISTVDEAAGFEYTIDWNDGTPLQTIARTPGNGAGVTRRDHLIHIAKK